MKSMKDYKEAFDSLVQWLDSFPDPSKVVAIFRPTIPGHVGCQPSGNNNWSLPVLETPHRSYNDYETTTKNALLNGAVTTQQAYNWPLIEEYNAYSRQALNQRSDDNDSSIRKRVKIHWLNVFNSSVLRRDGHVGFEDCLHFYNPGPTDWWVHFFYTMMLDLAAETEYSDGH